jgi:hypothetical protein
MCSRCSGGYGNRCTAVSRTCARTAVRMDAPTPDPTARRVPHSTPTHTVGLRDVSENPRGAGGRVPAAVARLGGDGWGRLGHGGERQRALDDRRQARPTGVDGAQLAARGGGCGDPRARLVPWPDETEGDSSRRGSGRTRVRRKSRGAAVRTRRRAAPWRIIAMVAHVELLAGLPAG